jgi:hypothetical protein
MLDDLRNQADDGAFLDDEEGDLFGYEEEADGPTLFLGMTPTQRFVIAVMVMFMICILSAFCLLVTERIYLPF